MLETRRTGNITTKAKKSLRGAFRPQRSVVHGNLFASNAHQWRHRAYRCEMRSYVGLPSGAQASTAPSLGSEALTFTAE